MLQSVKTNLPIEELVQQAGISAEIISVNPANAGGNNRIYRVLTSSGVYAVKQYFRHHQDVRNRLASEYLFLKYASKVVPEFVPCAYTCNYDVGLALYEFVDGAHIKPGEVTWQHVEQALAFFKAINQPKCKKFADKLPNASEACFSIAEHLNLVNERITRLHAVLFTIDESNQDAVCFIDELYRYWLGLAEKVKTEANELHQFDQLLDLDNCCVSPSDFGFHNALLQSNGTIRFIDFEYAGLDDPAKMVGDFFAQLAVPVPSAFFAEFVMETMQVFPDTQKLIMRAKWLRLVYQVKWCCIAMNVFLPEHMARRKFANANLDENSLRQTQLDKAKKILKTIQQENTHGIH